MMSSKSDINLQHFYVFNSSYSQREGEELKNILYYFPPKTEVDTQMKNVGLSEAIIKFTDTFSPDQPCESLHTQKSRQLLYQPEPGFWMVMYLTTLKLNHCDILDVFQGIQFLPLDKQTFLRVQCFVNLVEAMFPRVRHTAFLYNDQLVWSGLEPDDMQVVYRYLVTSLLPTHLETELQGGSMPRHPASPFTTTHYGRFVSGPSNLQDSAGSMGKIPKVYVNNSTGPEMYHLIVYRALSATLCMFVDGTSPLCMEMFKRMDVFVGPQLTALVSEVAEQCGKQAGSGASPTDPGPRFVYFNQLNLAQKSTVHLDARRSGNVGVCLEVLRLLADINSDKSRMSSTGEVILKTMTDYWVVGKLSNLREFYVVIHQKNANLIEINDEVRRVCEAQLKSIFFHD
ncbi:vacuolar fusion protein CCZ1 homolog isoform X2 [Bacillus rossius redtenbacheri]|uniref:vacuolar fusion protein CCZ1 homolog isoform X2 n=1 Tax=Bacillus rossius redtenbacheri TaxID=93214 RepID=UPI002FDCDF10